MNANAHILDQKITSAVRSKALTPDQGRIARAINDRFDGGPGLAALIGAAKILDADGPQWAFRIRKGYWLDQVRDALGAAAV